MFEAYSVGVRVSLINSAGAGLLLLARQFARADLSAAALQKRLAGIRLTLLSGAALAGTGAFGLYLIGKLVKPATEYAHQLNIMNMAGLSHLEVAQAIGAAWKNTGIVITTTATQNLKTLLDMRNVLGSMPQSLAALPIVSQIQAVLSASTEGRVRSIAGDNFAFSMAKALDIVGAAQDPAVFERQAAAMAKVIVAFQGRVTPQMFQSVFAYARQAKFGLNDEFKYSILPTLMLEYAFGRNSQGGGSRGVGPSLAAFARLTLQGYINRKALPELHRLGLLGPGAALHTTTTGTTVGALRGAELAAANPFLWVQTILMPAIEKKFGGKATTQQITQEILQITRGNQLASQVILEFALKQKNFLRDQKIIWGAMPYSQAYMQAMQNDPNFAYQALGAQWENLKTAFGISVIPIIVPAIMALTRGLNEFAVWAKAHPNLTKALTVGFAALSATLLFSGTVLLLAGAFKALRLTIFPLLGMMGAGGATGGAAGGAAAGAATRVPWIAAIVGGLMLGYEAAKAKERIERDKLPSWWMIPFAGMFDPRWWKATGAGKDMAGALDTLGADNLATALKKALDGVTVQMDGRVVGQIVTDHQNTAATRPVTAASGLDFRLSPAYPGSVY